MKLVWLALLAAYCGVIFYLSHQPSVLAPMLFPYQDKLFHAMAYGVLGFLSLGYFKLVLIGYKHVLIIALVFSALYGASDEWHQSFIAGRDADILDWLADCFGATLVISVMSFFSRKNQHLLSK
ncbi:MAG: teicoplanin resistance protein VanZ [Cycloclasticus sp.]|nr:MAG: teicoplanin resistance protein VanZ [Cycloclasticus sp.]